MSNLVKSLYEMASLRTEYQRLHQDLFGFSVRKLMFMARPGARKGVNARIHQLTKRLQELDEDMSRLTADDLVIRRGEEIEVALKDFSLAFAETLRQLDLVRQAEAPRWAKAQGEESRLQLAAYDDAIQHQRRMGARLNELIADL